MAKKQYIRYMKNALVSHRSFLLTALLFSLAFAAPAQQPDQLRVVAAINAATPPDQAIAPLIYLASDQLKGRYIGRPEIDTAALYIANQFREAGAGPLPGATGYFQVFTHRFNAGGPDTASKDVSLRNVLAFIPGTDPKLRDQYVVLSSHYDHLGVTKHPRVEEGKLDSIYNGARDNAS